MYSSVQNYTYAYSDASRKEVKVEEMSQEMVLLIIMQIIENVILSTIFYQKGLRAVDKVWMTPCIREFILSCSNKTSCQGKWHFQLGAFVFGKSATSQDGLLVCTKLLEIRIITAPLLYQ